MMIDIKNFTKKHIVALFLFCVVTFTGYTHFSDHKTEKEQVAVDKNNNINEVPTSIVLQNEGGHAIALASDATLGEDEAYQEQQTIKADQDRWSPFSKKSPSIEGVCYHPECFLDDYCYGIDCECEIDTQLCKVYEPEKPGICFSAMSTVHVSYEGPVPISDIRVGDLVKSKASGSFSRVYALEKNHYSQATFNQFLSSTGDVLLELTDRHMVYLKDKPMPVAAKEVRVGDILETVEKRGDGLVAHIKKINRDGHYMPVTEDGTIIVNNIVASSFSEARRSTKSALLEKTGLIHWQTVSQVGLAPLRFICKAVWFGLCEEERFHNEEGFHKLIVFLKDANTKYDDWRAYPLFLFFFGIGLLFSGLEYVYDTVEQVLFSSPELLALFVGALIPCGLLALRRKY